MTVLILASWQPSAALLRSVSEAANGAQVIVHDTEFGTSEFPTDIPDDVLLQVTVLLTWRCFPPPGKLPRLRYVQLMSAGCNHALGSPLFANSDIALCTANGVHSPQIAEWVFSTFLAFQHHLPTHLDNQKLCNWIAPEADTDTEDAVGLRVGILGYGCIGRQCARVAKAFGMSVYAYTLHERKTAEDRKDDSYVEPDLGDPDGLLPSKWFYGKDQLHDFLGSGLDLLIILLPLTDLTRAMISRKEFALLSIRKAYVCNAGRGPIVDTDALIEALQDGTIRGAALDVTDPEPLPAEHPLWTTKNAIVTPHVSGNSDKYNDRVLAILKQNLTRMTSGHPLLNCVDKSLGY